MKQKKQKKQKKVLFICSVGGHLTQMLQLKSLFEKYHGHCIITGIDHPKLLVASHIKPWAVCSNRERLSVENGLLLSATYDRLFDSGLLQPKRKNLFILFHWYWKHQSSRTIKGYVFWIGCYRENGRVFGLP